MTGPAPPDPPPPVDLRKLHRYTITSEGASPGYFRLVEDPKGAWVTWAEVEAHVAAAPPRQEPPSHE